MLLNHITRLSTCWLFQLPVPTECPHAKSWLIGKESDAGRDWEQEEKGTTEDEMAGWHHWLDGHEFEWTPGDGDGQGGLACCDSWGRKELDTTEQLNWLTDLTWQNVRASLLAAGKESTCNAWDPDLIPGFRRICWRRDRLPTPVFMPGGSDDKESACKAGDLGWIPRLGCYPGGGHGNPLQYSCLKNPHGQRNLADYSPKELDTTEKLSQRLTEFCQVNTLVIANILFQQHKRRFYTWTSPDSQYRNQIDYILCSQRWRSSKQSAKNKTGRWLGLRSWAPYCQIQT